MVCIDFGFVTSYPEQSELETIYSEFLTPVLQKNLSNHATWSSPSKAQQLAKSMVNIYEQVRDI